MKPENPSTRAARWMRGSLLAICGALLLGTGAGPFLAQESTQSTAPAAKPETAATPETAAPPDTAAAESAVKIPPEQLESLVAPIALYPDALLAQTLVASTCA